MAVARPNGCGTDSLPPASFPTRHGRDVKHIENIIARRHQLPKKGRNVSRPDPSTGQLTPEQLRALGAELAEVLERHLPPPASDTSSPPGLATRPVTISSYAVPTDVDSAGT
ncbi:hypothetical protein DFJ64_2608 [Thermasporomyces composti]|jgi:hypothetical protein|uniref:Uncharacterized protein n=1 Tax=Thermasporomyces composti TaxID=696763 RepID=A0A3D9V5X7_THECX|nr:hypothetical protein DFJ64_2608 [Thermasporomyces composti]